MRGEFVTPRFAHKFFHNVHFTLSTPFIISSFHALANNCPHIASTKINKTKKLNPRIFKHKPCMLTRNQNNIFL